MSGSSQVLSVMYQGLRALEMHPLLTDPTSLRLLVRFQSHALAFSRGFERILERRVARNIDRDHPVSGALSHQHLRIQRPFTRGLREHLLQLGRDRKTLEWMITGPRTRSYLLRADAAVEAGSAVLAQGLLVQGLECFMQMLAKRGQTMAQQLGHPSHIFEDRHLGVEDLLTAGLQVFDRANLEVLELTLAELEMLYADGIGALDEWRDTDPLDPPPGRERKRTSRWETGDLPGGGAA